MAANPDRSEPWTVVLWVRQSPDNSYWYASLVVADGTEYTVIRPTYYAALAALEPMIRWGDKPEMGALFV